MQHNVNQLSYNSSFNVVLGVGVGGGGYNVFPMYNIKVKRIVDFNLALLGLIMHFNMSKYRDVCLPMLE